jgi:hypothetical protein
MASMAVSAAGEGSALTAVSPAPAPVSWPGAALPEPHPEIIRDKVMQSSSAGTAAIRRRGKMPVFFFWLLMCSFFLNILIPLNILIANFWL